MVKTANFETALALMALLLLVFPCSTWAGPSDYLTVTGYASVADGRRDLARESALQNAFRQAVEQAVGVMIQAESVVNDFELIKDKISSQSAGFIRKYAISEEKFEGNICSVKIQALVSKVKLEKRLDSFGLLQNKMGKPRLVMLLSEQSALQDHPSYWWGDSHADTGIAENTIMAKLQQSDFNFVDRRSILANLKKESLAGKLFVNISNDAALKVLASGEAEVAIIGQATAKAPTSGVGGTNFKACQAIVSVRAINTDNGEVLGSFTATAVVPHVNAAAGGAQALAKAGAECAEKLQKQIVGKWKKRIQSAGIVRVIAAGLDYEEIKDFMALLKERIVAVEDVNERSYQDGAARLDVETGESAGQLAAEVSNLEFKGRVVKVVSLSANVLELKMSKKEPDGGNGHAF